MISHEPGTQNPLQENYLALLLCIVKKYSPDQALILMGAGQHCDASEEALENAREAITGFLEALKIQGKQLPERDSQLLFGEVEVHDSPTP